MSCGHVEDISVQDVERVVTERSPDGRTVAGRRTSTQGALMALGDVLLDVLLHLRPPIARPDQLRGPITARMPKVIVVGSDYGRLQGGRDDEHAGFVLHRIRFGGDGGGVNEPAAKEAVSVVEVTRGGLAAKPEGQSEVIGRCDVATSAGNVMAESDAEGVSLLL